MSMQTGCSYCFRYYKKKKKKKKEKVIMKKAIMHISGKVLCNLLDLPDGVSIRDSKVLGFGGDDFSLLLEGDGLPDSCETPEYPVKNHVCVIVESLTNASGDCITKFKEFMVLE